MSMALLPKARIAGFWPAHGDAVLDEHLAEDWLGIAQGRAVAQAGDLGCGGSLQIPGQETARQVDRPVHVREAGSTCPRQSRRLAHAGIPAAEERVRGMLRE